MGCGEQGDPNEKLHHDGWNSLKDRKRACCTDSLFLVCEICIFQLILLLIISPMVT
jgi:hypothetical protein